jgi:hypothetical protein
MYAQVEKAKENKSRSLTNSVAQKKSYVKQGFGFVDNRPLAQLQNGLRNKILDNRKTMQCSVIQRVDPPSASDGAQQGVLDATVNRLQPPRANLGSAFSFRLMASALITPLLTDGPRIPSTFRPYVTGYTSGFLSGTAARRFALRRIGVPAIVDTVMTLSNINNTAVRIDEQLAETPELVRPAEQFVEQVAESANQQHQRTNPYMTPNDPESQAEINSPI